jgi:hypothetical protein
MLDQVCVVLPHEAASPAIKDNFQISPFHATVSSPFEPFPTPFPRQIPFPAPESTRKKHNSWDSLVVTPPIPSQPTSS